MAYTPNTPEFSNIPIAVPFDGENVMLNCDPAEYDTTRLLVDIGAKLLSMRLSSGELLQIHRLSGPLDQIYGLHQSTPRLTFSRESLFKWTAIDEANVADELTVRKFGNLARAFAITAYEKAHKGPGRLYA